MIRDGVPAQLAGAIAESLSVIRDGEGEQRTDTVEHVLGRRPTTFEAWATKHKSLFC